MNKRELQAGMSNEEEDEEGQLDGGGAGASSSSKGPLYLPYDPSTFSLIHMYRPQNDVVAQLIVQSGMEGVDRLDISKRLGINAKIKAGNRTISNSIHAVMKAYPDRFGQFQKMEGRLRFIKYYCKGTEQTPAGGKAMAELFNRFQQLTGVECPYKLGEVIKFPAHDLRPLRMSDVALKRMVRILECVHQEKALTRFKLDAQVSAMEREEGYAYQMDRKTLRKYLIALSKRHFLNLLQWEVIERNQPASVDVITVPEIRSLDHPTVVAALDAVLAEYREQSKSFPSGVRIKQEPVVTEDAKDQEQEPETEDQAEQQPEEEELLESPVKQEPPEEGTTSSSAGRSSLLHLTFNKLQQQSLKKYARKGGGPIVTLSQRSLNTLVDSARHRRLTRISGVGARKRKIKQEEAEEGGQPGEFDDNQQMMMEGTSSSSPPKAQKRIRQKLDRIDIQSLQHKAYLRSRFTQRERDMLLLIRALSFFLNPVQRFWPHPKVVRMLMHEYVPESRTKTTYSLMAAGVREMRSRDRYAHHQYIVKTMASFKELLDLRNELARMNMSSQAPAPAGNDQEGQQQLRPKDYFFCDAFRASYQLLFRESPDFPSVHVADADLRRYLTRNKLYFLTISNRIGAEMRTQKPLDEHAVRHCAAYNTIMSVLLSAKPAPESGVKTEANPPDADNVGDEQAQSSSAATTTKEAGEDDDDSEAMSNFVIEQLGIQVLADVVAQMRTDGLIIKKRGSGLKLKQLQEEQRQQQTADGEGREPDQILNVVDDVDEEQQPGIATETADKQQLSRQDSDQLEQKLLVNDGGGSGNEWRNQLGCTQFYRHYFQKDYHKQLTGTVCQLYWPLFDGEPSAVDEQFAAGDNPGELLVLANHLCQSAGDQQSPTIETTMPNSINELFAIADAETTYQLPSMLTAAATKQLRYLESAELQLDLVHIRPQGIGTAAEAMLRALPEPAELVRPQLIPSHKMPPIPEPEVQEIGEKQQDKVPETDDGTTQQSPIYEGNAALQKLFDTIDQAGVVGISEEELKEQFDSVELLDMEHLQRQLDTLLDSADVLACGVDRRRYVSTRNGGPWLVRNREGQGFVPRPWLIPSGQVNWGILRWMLEGVFSLIFNRPGLTTDDLVSHFLFVLQPSFTVELLQILVQIGCCTVCEKVLTGMHKTAPFSRFGKIQTIKYVTINTDGMQRLILFVEHKLKPLLEQGRDQHQQQQMINT